MNRSAQVADSLSVNDSRPADSRCLALPKIIFDDILHVTGPKRVKIQNAVDRKFDRLRIAITEIVTGVHGRIFTVSFTAANVIPAKRMSEMTRDDAWQLLNEYTRSASLIKHALAVEAAMRHYAARFGESAGTWGVTGLLHDFDYERWPDPPGHTREGARILRGRGVDDEIIGAILSHAEWNREDYPLDRPIRRALFAVDELSGFVTAVAYVRPERLAGMTAKSVKKKMNHRAFAAAVKREDIVQGAELLGLPLDDHINNVIASMDTIAVQLGFA